MCSVVVWCGVVLRRVVWCGVVWCGVRFWLVLDRLWLGLNLMCRGFCIGL